MKCVNVIDDNFEKKFDEIINFEYKKKYTETVNQEMCDYLLKLDNDTLKELIWDPVEIFDQSGEKWDEKAYIRYVKKLLKKFKDNKYIYSCSYKQVDQIGRRFTLDGGIQNLQNRLKYSLVNGICYDYDMKNMHPQIILYLFENYFPNLSHSYLKQYVDNREKVLNDFKLDKFEILKTINKSKLKTENSWLKCFHMEITNLQDILFDKFKDNDKIVINSKQNYKGSLLNKILCSFENYILNKAEQYIFEKYNIYPDSLIFDGMHYKLPNLINDLNESSKEFGITWTIKQPKNLIKIDNSIISSMYIPEDENYYGVKKKFEQNHFLIMQPDLKFCREVINEEGNKDLVIYSSQNSAITYCKPWKYKVINDKGMIVKQDFYKKWLEDEDRRICEKFDFYPIPLQCPSNIYNQFTGFNYQNWEEKEDSDYSIIQNHLKYLVGKDKTDKCLAYLEQWTAHILFNPGNIPKIAIIMRSLEKQIGKNLFFNTFFNNCLYDSATFDTTNPEHVFGKFGKTYKKFVVTLNEQEIKKNYDLINTIKSFITEKKIVWEPKGKDALVVNNFARFVFLANEFYCVKLEQGDKRFVAFNNEDLAKDGSYYEQLVKALNDKNILKSYITYLKSIYDEKYNFQTNRVLTQYYFDLQQVTIPTMIDFWIYVIQKHKQQNIDLNATDLYNLYTKWSSKKGFTSYTQTKFGRYIKTECFISKYRTNSCYKYVIDCMSALQEFKLKLYIDEDMFQILECAIKNNSDSKSEECKIE
jgi:hypothetical protein